MQTYAPLKMNPKDGGAPLTYSGATTRFSRRANKLTTKVTSVYLCRQLVLKREDQQKRGRQQIKSAGWVSRSEPHLDYKSGFVILSSLCKMAKRCERGLSGINTFLLHRHNMSDSVQSGYSLSAAH